METRPESNNRPVVESSNLSFTVISKLLAGHLSYLLHHLMYLSRIEKSLIDQEKVKDYLYDVFGFSSKKIDATKFINDFLPKIKAAVKQRADVYSCLVKATEVKDQEQAICLLNLLLERECGYESIYKTVSKAKDVKLEDKLQTAFYDYTFVKMLHSALQPLLPECYPTLTKVVKVKEEFISEAQSRDYSADININWNNLTRNFINDLVSFTGQIIGQKKISQLKNLARNNSKPDDDKIKAIIEDKNSNKKNISNISVGLTLEKITNLLNNQKRAEALIQTRKSQNEIDSKKLKTENDKFKLLEANISIFFQIYPAHRDLLNATKKAADNVNKEENISDKYKKLSKTLKKKKDKLLSKQDLITKKLKSLKEELKAIKLYEEDIASDVKGCNADLDFAVQQAKKMQYLPEIRPITINSEEQIHSLQTDFENKYDDVNTKLYSIERTIEFYNNLILIQKENLANAAKLKEEEENKKTQEEQDSLKKQKEEFRARRHDDLKLYREGVIKKREEKKLVKLEDKKKLASTFFNQEKHVQYKNVIMEDLLKKLSPNNLELLKSILNFESGITYNDVCNLITNHLGGRIIEIGSSHKRFEIGVYILSLVTNDNFENIDEVTDDNLIDADEIGPQTAKGGFFRQHKKGRSQRVQRDLCHANLELINNTLVKAGITLEALDKLKPQP